MLRCTAFVIASISTLALFASQSAEARGVMLDSGAWDTIVSTNSNASASENVDLAFNMSIFGVTGNAATMTSDGSVVLSGASDTAQFDALFDVDQTQGGRQVLFSVEETNGDFDQAGISAGVRFTWNVLDSSSSVLNSVQIAMFELATGQFALLYNYDLITFGDDSSSIGYSTSLGDSFDLAAALGLSFTDYQGEGDIDPTFPDLCPNTPDALACNNYFDGVFGPSNDILPDLAGGYFLGLSGTDNTPAQGRYMWLSDTIAVVEPPVLAMLGLGLLALARARRRHR